MTSGQSTLYFGGTDTFAPRRKTPRRLPPLRRTPLGLPRLKTPRPKTARSLESVTVNINGPPTPNSMNNRGAPKTPNRNNSRNLPKFKKILEERFKLYLQFLNAVGFSSKYNGANRNILLFLEPALKLVRPTQQRNRQQRTGVGEFKQRVNNARARKREFLASIGINEN